MSKHRLGYLDSLRGIAALAVALFHFILNYEIIIREEGSGTVSFWLLESFLGYFDLGKIAVTIFFMISGFVIPYSVKGNGISSLKRFAVSRFFRLYPVYWTSVILGTIVFSNTEIVTSLINLTMLQQFIGVPNVIGLYWTLQLELVFYFLFGLLLLLKYNSNKKVLFLSSVFFLVIAVVMATFRYYLHQKLPLAMPLSLSVMFFGSYWRNCVLDKDKLSFKYVKIYLILYVFLLPIVCAVGYDIDFGFNETWERYLISYSISMLVFLVANYFKLANRVFIFFGAISYSVYLFHPIAFNIVNPVIETLVIPTILKIMLNIVVAMLFSILMYKYIEMPCVRLGKKIRARIINE